MRACILYLWCISSLHSFSSFSIIYGFVYIFIKLHLFKCFLNLVLFHFLSLSFLCMLFLLGIFSCHFKSLCSLTLLITKQFHSELLKWVWFPLGDPFYLNAKDSFRSTDILRIDKYTHAIGEDWLQAWINWIVER